MGERRIERVEGTATGAELVGTGFQRKAGAAILKDDAGFRASQPRSELPEDALDEADDAAFAVGRAHPDRVAVLRFMGPGERALSIDPGMERIEIL